MAIDNTTIKLYDYTIKMWKSVRYDNSCQAEYLWHIASIFTEKYVGEFGIYIEKAFSRL